MNYKELHNRAEQLLVQILTKKGHKVERQKAINHEVLFDVWDATQRTAWEVLTAKIVRSSHEQDEAIITKIFRYLLIAKRLKFLIVSFDHNELEMFHSLGLEHWHTHNHWWHTGQLSALKYHKGKTARQIANRIFKAMINYAPLSEWTREGRRKDHPKTEKIASDFERISKKIGLPKNFLIGMWRDYRLMWCWKLEKILPIWAKRFK
jgi:hypothetical protein